MATPVSRNSARKRNNDESIVVVTNIHLYDRPCCAGVGAHDGRRRGIWSSIMSELSSPATETELRNYARDHLAHFKCPQRIQFMSELPKTGTGKVQKYVLRGKQPSISKHCRILTSDFRLPIPSKSKNVAFVLRHSFVIRHSSFVCPLLLCPSCRKQPPARSRSMSFAGNPRFRNSDRPNDVAILTKNCASKTSRSKS